MCTRGDCIKHMGNWVQFHTPWGYHRGIIADVNDRAVLVRMPRRYVPAGLASFETERQTDEERLDLALAQWGWGYPYGGWGYPGWGAWRGGWWWWWLGFAWIWALALLW